MSTQIETTVRSAVPSESLSAKTLKGLADDIYESLKKDGCQTRDIVTVSTRLLELVTDNLRVDDVTPRRR